MSTETVQKLVRPLKIYGGVEHTSSSEEKIYATSCKMEERFGSWRKSARSFYNSRLSKHTALIVVAVFIAFQAFALVLNGGDGGEIVRSRHSSFTSSPLLSQVNLFELLSPFFFVQNTILAPPFLHLSRVLF